MRVMMVLVVALALSPVAAVQQTELGGKLRSGREVVIRAAVQAKLERLATFKAELEAKADRYTTALAGLQDPSDVGVAT